MRLVASFLLCVATLGAGAAEIYRWKDANGVTHYTDYPVAGAERVNIAVPTPSVTSPEPPPIILPNVTTPPEAARGPTYTTCAVTSPRNDEALFGVQPVTIQLNVVPAVQNTHRVQVFINGVQRDDWPGTATSFTLPEIVRGSHAVSARIVDQNGRILCSGPSITFHLRQASVLSPLNPNNPNNPNNRPPTAPRPPPAPRTP